TYFGLWGRPAHEDWQVEHVIGNVADAKRQVALGMIPSIPRFDGEAFEFYIALHKYPIEVRRLWGAGVNSLGTTDYILMCENDQGYATLFTNDNPKLNAYVMEHPDQFLLLERFLLPNADVIRLYKVQKL